MAVPHSGVPAPATPPPDAELGDVTAETLTVSGASTLAGVTATSIAAPHSTLTGVTADQHHAQSHAHNGLDSSGTVAHAAVTGIGANDHHAQAHAVTGADHTASGLTAGHVMRATGATTFAFGALADADVPATIARDTEVTTAVSDHAALADPHAGYVLESDHTLAAHDTLGMATQSELDAHAHSFRGAKAYNSAAQSVASASIVALTFGSEEYDTSAIHDNATNPTRFTIPAGMGGKWRLAATACFAANTTGVRVLKLRKNGTTDLIGGRRSFEGEAGTSQSFDTTVDENLVAGDYIEAIVFQDSGGALNVGGTTNETMNAMWCEYRGA